MIGRDRKGLRTVNKVWLEVTAGPDVGSIVRMDSGPFFVGRGSENDLRIADHKASRRHAVLALTDNGRLVIEDVGSENGTIVRGREIAERTFVHPGDEIRIGDTVLRVSDEPPTVAAPRRWARASLVSAVIVLAALIGIGTWVMASDPVTPTTLATTTTASSTTTTSPPLSIADVVDAARTSVLKVLTLDGAGQVLGSGTGWVYDGDQGLIATNNHVISGGAGFSLSGDGVMRGEERPATFVATAPCEDLALIQISDSAGLTALTLGSQAELRPGDEVVALGFPSDASTELPLAATAGVVSVVETRLSEPDLFDVPHLSNVIRTDAAINPGNSGGPLLTIDMRLVGVNTAGFTERDGRTIQNENYAIGVDRAREILEELAAGDSIGWVGLNLTTFFTDGGDAFLVTVGVVPDSPADVAGVPSVPLIIEEIDGSSMDGTLQRYCEVVGSYRSGDSAVFRFGDPNANEQFDVEIDFG